MSNEAIDDQGLRQILESIAKPNSLADHPILNSWIVEEYLEENPQGVDYSAEYLIGKALERQLRLWGDELQMGKQHIRAWKEIFCVKECYFQERQGVHAYRERSKLDALGAVLVDVEKLAKLVPGRESEADMLRDDPDLHEFWLTFAPSEKTEAIPPSTADGILKRGIKHLTERIETRRSRSFRSHREH